MKRTNSKTLNFLRRNALYLILALCIAAIGLSVTLVLVNKYKAPATDASITDPIEPDKDPVTPVEPDDPVIDPTDPTEPDEPVIKPISFVMPVENATDIGEYSEQMVFSSTMNRFTAHLAIDFFAPEGTDVVAVADGTVEKVETTLLQGTTIVINHGNGLKTIYNSLADGESVALGKTVKKGEAIGKVSVTNRQESKEGAHLHFQVEENGEIIDPAKYLQLDEK